MIDEHTIPILEKAAVFIGKEDKLLVEYLGYLADNRTAARMRTWLHKRGIDAKNDRAWPWKGRTYYNLEQHPLVRKRRSRMRRIKTELVKRRKMMILFSENIIAAEKDSRTEHWFTHERVG